MKGNFSLCIVPKGIARMFSTELNWRRRRSSSSCCRVGMDKLFIEWQTCATRDGSDAPVVESPSSLHEATRWRRRGLSTRESLLILSYSPGNQCRAIQYQMYLYLWVCRDEEFGLLHRGSGEYCSRYLYSGWHIPLPYLLIQGTHREETARREEKTFCASLGERRKNVCFLLLLFCNFIYKRLAFKIGRTPR